METILFGNLSQQSYSMKESLRALRTNLQFCGDDLKVIMITSAVPNEGKSTVSIELARSLVELGKKVLVIDTDMRKSVLVGRMRASAKNGKEVFGLSHYLSGQKKLNEVLYSSEVEGLSIIFAGPSVPNPTELLEKKYFTEMIQYAGEQFDYVLVDCAPIGATIDAAVLAKHCNGAIMVVAQGMASCKEILSAKSQLEIAGVKILGVVLNKVKVKQRGYYGKYYGQYYGSYGTYGSEK